jgi:hypothetical protein
MPVSAIRLRAARLLAASGGLPASSTMLGIPLPADLTEREGQWLRWDRKRKAGKWPMRPLWILGIRKVAPATAGV